MSARPEFRNAPQYPPNTRKGRPAVKVQSSYTFDAGVQTVWDSMQSPQTLSGCIPGCEKFEPTGENAYAVELNVRVSAVSGKYSGEVRIEDSDHLNSYRMVVEGRGRGGTVRGTADLSFSESDGQTKVDITGDAQVTGIVARVGQRLLGGASRMMMNQFFNCLKTKIEAQTT